MKNFLQVLLVGTILVSATNVIAKVVAVTNPEGGGLAKNILEYGNDAESVLVKGGANATLAQQFGWWESNIYGANKGWDVYGVKDLKSISGNGSYMLYDTDTGKLVGSYHNGTISYNQTGQSLGLKIPAGSTYPGSEAASGASDLALNFTSQDAAIKAGMADAGVASLQDMGNGTTKVTFVNGSSYIEELPINEVREAYVPAGSTYPGSEAASGASDLALNFTSQDAAIKAGMADAGVASLQDMGNGTTKVTFVDGSSHIEELPINEVRESFVPAGSEYPGASYLEIANPDNAPVQLGDTNYFEQLNGDITNKTGAVVGYIDDNGAVHFTDSAAYADAVAQHNGITGMDQLSDGGVRVNYSDGSYVDFTAQEVADGAISGTHQPAGWVDDSISYQGKQVAYYNDKGELVVTVEGTGAKVENVEGTDYQVRQEVTISTTKVPVASIPAPSVVSRIPAGMTTAKVLSVNGDTATLLINNREFKLPSSELGTNAGAFVGKTVALSGDAASKLGAGFGAYFDTFLGDFGGSFGNFFDSAVNTVMMPFKLGKGIWDTGAKILSGNTKGMGDAIGNFFSKGFSNMGTNITAGFNSFSAAGKMMMASPADLTKMAQSGMDVFGNTTASIEEFFNIQYDAAGNLTAESQAAVAEKLAGMPAAVSNVAQYPIMILQTHEAGNQDDTTKSVKVKSENALEASQGSTTDSTVGTTLDGTNMASAAVAMATLLKNNPVDLNLLKESDLDLTKDKDQKTLRQRRDLLLQMYAVSAQVIAEGSMAISSAFYERINQLAETLSDTTGSLGAASVLNDSERYPYFEMVRQTALSATQLGLKGAAALPNLQGMHSYHINNNK